MILGLDISTSIVGITFLSDNGERVGSEYIPLKKYDDFYDKVQFFQKEIIKLYNKYVPQEEEIKIYIEQSLQAFRPGLSSAKVIVSLVGMNKVLSWVLFEMFSVKPEYISATSARKMCGIKIPKGEKSKPLVLKFLLDTETDFVVEYTPRGNPKPHYYDIADSIVIARAGYVLWKQTKN